jgi:hypothetical protein
MAAFKTLMASAATAATAASAAIAAHAALVLRRLVLQWTRASHPHTGLCDTTGSTFIFRVFRPTQQTARPLANRRLNFITLVT